MRTNRLIVLLLLTACKAITPTLPASSYSEDLSIHRPVVLPVEEESEEQEVKTEPYTPLQGHIRQELDSISKVAYLENKKGKYVEGYVIQVYSGNSRDEANRARYKMHEFFPELDPKVAYYQPNFRVKAGQWTDRLKAHRTYQQVKEEFPRALLIPERFLIKYD